MRRQLCNNVKTDSSDQILLSCWNIISNLLYILHMGNENSAKQWNTHWTSGSTSVYTQIVPMQAYILRTKSSILFWGATKTTEMHTYWEQRAVFYFEGLEKLQKCHTNGPPAQPSTKFLLNPKQVFVFTTPSTTFSTLLNNLFHSFHSTFSSSTFKDSDCSNSVQYKLWTGGGKLLSARCLHNKP